MERVGYFNTKYKISADYDFILRVFLVDGLNVFYYNHVGVKMKSGGISNRSFLNLLRKMLEDYDIIRENKLGSFYTLMAKSFRKLPQFF